MQWCGHSTDSSPPSWSVIRKNCDHTFRIPWAAFGCDVMIWCSINVHLFSGIVSYHSVKYPMMRGRLGLRSCELLAPYCTQSLEQVATEDLWEPDPGSHRVKRQTVHKVFLCLSLASLHLHILKLSNSSTMVWREHKFFHPISRNMKWKLFIALISVLESHPCHARSQCFTASDLGPFALENASQSW